MLARLRSLARLGRPLANLVMYYPLLLAVVVGLLPLVWGLVLTEYDAFHLIWTDEWWVGIVNGVLTSSILGLVFMSAYLCDESAAARESGAGTGSGAKPPGWAYPAAWAVVQVVYASPAVWKTLPPRDGEPDPFWWRVWFPIGMVLLTLGHYVGRSGIKLVPKSTPKLGGIVLGMLGVGYILMTILHGFFPTFYLSPLRASVSVLLYFAFLTAGLGAVTYWAGARARWLFPALGFLVLLAVIRPEKQVENRLPNMADIVTGRDYYDDGQRPQLVDYKDLRSGSGGGLADDRDSLEAWHNRMKAEFGSHQPLFIVTCSGGASASAIYTADVLLTYEELFPGFSKRIRLISGASGGMLGAAYFVTQLRPGGIIARAQETPAYRAYLDARRKNLSPTNAEIVTARARYDDVMRQCRVDFFRGLEADFLSQLVQKWVHKDIPLSPFGFLSSEKVHTTNDRGSALEQAWGRHLTSTDEQGVTSPALDVPVADLRDEERRGALPSLVFTPMMIEDGRQLVISNLNLNYMVESGRDEYGKKDAEDQLLSLMGMEFFKLFPNARSFKLSTAVRMNASFPFFSPAAALPTNPVRHVVDAGYYDNFGMVVATKWLLQDRNREFLNGPYARDLASEGKFVPEVYLLRIRCFGNQQTPRMIPTQMELETYAGRELSSDELAPVVKEWQESDRKKLIYTESGLFTLTAPFTGLFAAWHANMGYRADERLASVLRQYNASGGPQPVRVRVSEFPLFCRSEPSLNWVLSARDIAAIHKDVHDNKAIQEAVETLTKPENTKKPPPTADVLSVMKRKAGDKHGLEKMTTTQKVVLDAKIDLGHKLKEMDVPKK